MSDNKTGTKKLKPQKGGSEHNNNSMPDATKPMKGGKRSKKSTHSKKSKTKKSKMAKDEAYCLVCRKRVKMSNVKETTTKNNRTMMKADGSCGHTVYRLG